MVSFAHSFTERWSAPFGYREVLRVGLPLIASMASSTLMQFTDRLFLSHYSVDAIAAAGAAGAIGMVPQLTLMGFCGYVSVLIAQYTGARLSEKVGPALWQGVWAALGGGLVLGLFFLAARPLFIWADHGPALLDMEITYFRILSAGGVFFLLSAVFSGFFVGRGITRPVMVANITATILNVPLDYIFIFGKCGLPELGIAGAGYATVTGWIFCSMVLACRIFTRRNDRHLAVLRGWRLNGDMFRRLVRYGFPSGLSMFMEVVGFAWFVLEVGKLGRDALAASNIALTINTLVFMPMLGLTSAIATLTGQAMGRQKPLDAEQVTISALHMSLAYMLPIALCFVLFGGPLMDLFRPADAGDSFVGVRETGIVLLYYVALYTLADSCNIVYLGALKGAGDTLVIMLILGGTGLFCLVLPVLALKYLGLASLHSLWLVLSVYVIIMAGLAMLRYRSRRWPSIRMVG